MSKRSKVVPVAPVVAAPVSTAPATAPVKRLTLVQWAIHLVRTIATHQHKVAVAFLTDPAPFFAPGAKLTTAQLCGIFNYAMSCCGTGVKMPTDAQNEKMWDEAIYKRGLDLASGRQIALNHWVSQTYQPLKLPASISGAKLDSFYTALTNFARTGLISDVDAAQFKDNTQEALREWFGAVLGNGKTAGTLTGSKDQPGPLAYSFRSVAVRADLPPQQGRKRGGSSKVTAESLLAQYGVE